MAYGRGVGGKDPVLFRGLATGHLFQGVYGQHKLDLFFLLFRWGEVTSVGEQSWEDWEANVIRVHDVKFPDNQNKYYVTKKELGSPKIKTNNKPNAEEDGGVGISHSHTFSV